MDKIGWVGKYLLLLFHELNKLLSQILILSIKFLIRAEIAWLFFKTTSILSSKLMLALMVKLGVFESDLGNVFGVDSGRGVWFQGQGKT